MSDRTYCQTCDRWVGGGIGHDTNQHDFIGPGPIQGLNLMDPNDLMDTHDND